MKRSLTFAVTGLLVALTLAALWALLELPSRAAPGDTPIIYDIQYTTNPGGDNTYPSLSVGQVVTTSGTVCAVLKRGYIISPKIPAPGTLSISTWALAEQNPPSAPWSRPPA